MERPDNQCTDRLNRRNHSYHHRQVDWLIATVGESPPPIENISQTHSRVKRMILKLGIFLVAVGIVKLCVAAIMKLKEKRDKE